MEGMICVKHVWHIALNNIYTKVFEVALYRSLLQQLPKDQRQ